MGYTHYFSIWQVPSPDEWSTFIDEVGRILAHPVFVDQLCWESNDPQRAPQVDATVVRFNGREKMGYETFYLARPDPSDSEKRGFCKTGFDVDANFRVYDFAVCAVLISAHRHVRARVGSDGGWDDPGWLLARAVYFEVTGEFPACPWASPLAGQAKAPKVALVVAAQREATRALRKLRRVMDARTLLRRGWDAVAPKDHVASSPQPAIAGRRRVVATRRRST